MRKLRSGSGNWIGSRYQLNAWILQKGRKHQGECPAQSCNANFEGGAYRLRHGAYILFKGQSQ